MTRGRSARGFRPIACSRATRAAPNSFYFRSERARSTAFNDPINLEGPIGLTVTVSNQEKPDPPINNTDQQPKECDGVVGPSPLGSHTR